MAGGFLGAPGLARMIAGVVREYLARTRGADAPALGGADPAALDFGDAGLALDSIERVELAAEVGERFGISDVGLEDLLLARHTVGGWAALVQRAWAAGATHLAFRTSGSTGTPTTCRHGLATLAQEADALAALFADRQRVVAAVPPHHIYGFLFTALLPDRLGVPVVDAEAAGPTGLAALLRDGDLLVTFPLRWDLLVRHGARFPAGVVGTTSTGPCRAETARAVRGAGLDRLVEVYGASETAGVGWREGPEAPYRLFPYWRPTGDATRRLVRTLPDGTDAPPVALMDGAEWVDAERFRLAGRRDAAVQVAGVNVFPAAVAERLRAHPLVTDCRVRLQRPEEGRRLKAFVVPAAPVTAEARADLDAWTRAHFPAPERPVALAFGPSLPLSPAGKDADW